MQAADLTKIRLILTDVDGVLTDGRLARLRSGEELKFFSIYDGLGIRMAEKAGLQVGFISGRSSSLVAQRAKELGVKLLVQGCSNKAQGLLSLLEEAGVSAEQTAYVGDDLPDLAILMRVGFPVAPANAAEEVKACARLVTRSSGGNGVLREVIEVILKAQGKWEGLVRQFQ